MDFLLHMDDNKIERLEILMKFAKDLDIDLMANQFGETGFDYLSEGTREKLKEKFPELVPDEWPIDSIRINTKQHFFLFLKYIFFVAFLLLWVFQAPVCFLKIIGESRDRVVVNQHEYIRVLFFTE